MSFGCSIGDFVAVLQLTNKLRKDFVNAPGQFKAISDELRSLSIVLQDAEVAVPLEAISERQRTNLSNIISGCQTVLEELQATIHKNYSIGLAGSKFDEKVKRVWKKLRWEPNDVREIRARVTTQVTLLDAFMSQLSSAVVIGTKRVVDKLNQSREEKYRSKILDWLTPIDYAAQQNDLINRRQENTGQWFLDSPEYKTWLQGPGTALVCPGMPGAGKTMLTAIVVNDLKLRFHRNPNIAIAYIYFNFRQKDDQTVLHLVCSVLRQILEHRSHLPDSIIQLYEDHKKRQARLSLDKALAAIRSMIALHYTQLFVIVDAIDECATVNGTRSRFLSELLNLQSTRKASVFTTSRFNLDVTNLFSHAIVVEIWAHDEDVRRVIEGNLKGWPSFVAKNYELQEEIVTEIMKTVNGMFLLAKLHLDSLRGKRSPKALRLALSRLSSGTDAYDQAYEEAMERIESQLKDERDFAKEALSWISFAKSPLTTIQLRHALAIEEGTLELDTDNLSQIEDIISVCAGLVTVDEESDVVRLVHYTTQEYFDRTKSRWFPDAEHQMTRACVTYLSFREFEARLSLDSADFEQRIQSNPLFCHAAKYWGEYARESHSCPNSTINKFLESEAHVEAAIQALFPETIKLQEIFRLYFIKQRNFKRLHLVAFFGLEALVRQLLETDDANLQDAHGRTPISYAAKNGHEAVVRVLAHKRHYLDQKYVATNVDLQDFHGRTPISYAAEGGHEAVVKLLVDCKAKLDPLCKDAFGNTCQSPLLWAFEQGHQGVIICLLDSGARVKVGDDENILGLAALKGYNDVVRYLLDNFHYVNSRSGLRSMTPLHKAVRNGHDVVIRTLLAAGADIESSDSHGQTPIFHASLAATVRLLLDHGAYHDIKDNFDMTPLMVAVWHGSESAARLLLERGTNPNSETPGGQTPLHFAVSGGHETSAKLLIEKGAEINAVSSTGQAPIHIAALSGHVGIASMLLKNGADQSIADCNGQTPFQSALCLGYKRVLKLLLEYSGGSWMEHIDDTAEPSVSSEVVHHTTTTAKGTATIQTVEDADPLDQMLKFLLNQRRLRRRSPGLLGQARPLPERVPWTF